MDTQVPQMTGLRASHTTCETSDPVLRWRYSLIWFSTSSARSSFFNKRLFGLQRYLVHSLFMISKQQPTQLCSDQGKTLFVKKLFLPLDYQNTARNQFSNKQSAQWSKKHNSIHYGTVCARCPTEYGWREYLTGLQSIYLLKAAEGSYVFYQHLYLE